MPSSRQVHQFRAYQRLTAATGLLDAAREIKVIGEDLGLTHPAVVDDYSQRRLFTAEDGMALSEVFGWEPDFQRDWVERSLHRVSPVGAVCRVTTRPFSWTATSMTALAQELGGRAGRWHLTPERGIAGGISVPIHLPRCGVGSVTWTTRDGCLNLDGILRESGDLLRMAALRFMDLVYAGRRDEPTELYPAAFSEREIECLTWVALGRTDGEIAKLIHRSPTTARFHVENAMAKLGARNRAQAVAIACQLGLIHGNDAHHHPDSRIPQS